MFNSQGVIVQGGGSVFSKSEILASFCSVFANERFCFRMFGFVLSRLRI